MTDETLDQLERLASTVVLRTADAEVAVVPVLVAEVKRLRAILAALREPSDAVVTASYDSIRYAVAVAEQEVSDG
jgi:uroporphyrinogen-III synthase